MGVNNKSDFIHNMYILLMWSKTEYLDTEVVTEFTNYNF